MQASTEYMDSMMNVRWSLLRDLWHRVHVTVEPVLLLTHLTEYPVHGVFLPDCVSTATCSFSPVVVAQQLVVTNDMM